MNLTKHLLEYSYENKLSHIASALSMLDYIDVLFTGKYVTPEDYIVIGKPFAAQAYYLVWQKMGYLTDIEQLSVGVKHDEIEFVDYGEETMGNALGVAAGIAMTTDQRVWVNISDACLQMGNTLEAIQFIGHNNISNLYVTVDYNNAQVTGNIDTILKIDPIINLCRSYGWWVQEVDGHDRLALSNAYNSSVSVLPNIIFCRTRKGKGIKTIEDDIKKWHYKKIETSTELQSLVQELQDI
jgi:transketolase